MDSAGRLGATGRLPAALQARPAGSHFRGATLGLFTLAGAASLEKENLLTQPREPRAAWKDAGEGAA